MRVSMVRKPTVISTFAGCGGSSLGYKWAGFKELLAIDFDENAVKTFQMNFPDVTILKRDIKEIKAEEVLKICKIKKGELDVLDGSPPCQGFSTAGKRQVYDLRNDLFKEYVRFIDGLKPKVFIMENVSGMMKGTMKGKFNEILSALKSQGYNVKVKLMNAMWYDVPQSRERLIFIGVRSDLNIIPSFPKPLNYIITVREALDGIKPDEIHNCVNKTLKYWNKTNIGQGVGLYLARKKINPFKPSNTQAKSRPHYHYKEAREMASNEQTVLQSFPINYKFVGSFYDKTNRIGNSVPPKMMYHIAKHVKEKILK